MVGLGRRPRDWDRFAKWAPGAAILVLLAMAALLLAAALTARDTQGDQAPAVNTLAPPTQTAGPTNADGAKAGGAKRDTDLQLYDRIAQRVGEGENYYAVAVEEQRANDFPVRPGLAVRLPTLALVSGYMGQWGMAGLALLLTLTTLSVWWYKLRDEPGGEEYRTFMLLLLVIGAASGMKPQYLALHEVWAGMLIALSIGLKRPKKWFASWLVAALALSIRELALPFVLLMGTIEFVRGRKIAAIAWAVLAGLFVIALSYHLLQVGQVTNPADPASPSWMALRGLGGWTANIVLSSALYHLPPWLAAPLALLPLIGWAGWRSDTGLICLLMCLGYGTAFMIAGRDNNFYWALVVMPVWFVGLAYVPRALSSLWNSARGS